MRAYSEAMLAIELRRFHSYTHSIHTSMKHAKEF